MNEYKVLEVSGSGELTASITAISEKDARRIFREKYTGTGQREITVTLVRENVPATKQQEREALEKIKAIVATLGPRSYIGTALDGCLEDAEVNIENDFGDSMKARWQDAEKRVAQAVGEIAELKDKLHREIQEKQQARGEAQAAIREAEQRADRAIKTAEDDANFYRDKVLDSDDLTDIAQLVEDKLAAIEETVNTGACCIVAAEEHPESELFQNAVRDHRNAQRKLEYYQALAQRIKHAQGQ